MRIFQERSSARGLGHLVRRLRRRHRIANDTLYGLGAGCGAATATSRLPGGPRHQRPGGCGPTATTSTPRTPRSADTNSPASAGNHKDDARPLPADQEPALVSCNDKGRRLLLRVAGHPHTGSSTPAHRDRTAPAITPLPWTASSAGATQIRRGSPAADGCAATPPRAVPAWPPLRAHIAIAGRTPVTSQPIGHHSRRSRWPAAAVSEGVYPRWRPASDHR